MRDAPLQSDGAETLLKPADVARTLAVEEHTLAVWRCTGRQPLPYVKFGSSVRYRKSDVDAFVQSNLQCA